MGFEKELKQFHARCQDVVASRFILAEKRISELLKCVVLTEPLFRIAESCLVDFNYEVEFVKAKTADPATGKFRLSLPEQRDKLAAFVFCLLSEIESKRRDLQRFLEEYYGESVVEAYAKFCREIILPFEAVMDAVSGELGDEPAQQSERGAEEKFFGADFASISNSTIEELVAVCAEFSRLAAEEKSFTGRQKQDLQFLLEAFCRSLPTRDRKLIRALYVGVANAFQGYKKFFEGLNFLEKTLKELWIV